MTDALADLLALDDAPRANEPWPIEPRDNDPASEEMRQRKFITALRRQSPGTVVWAVPNAAKRSRWAAGKAKREGMMAGVLDLTITWSNGSGANVVPGSAYIEMKNGKDMPSEAQEGVLNALYRQGHNCGVFRTPEAALAFLRRCGAPFGVREI